MLGAPEILAHGLLAGFEVREGEDDACALAHVASAERVGERALDQQEQERQAYTQQEDASGNDCLLIGIPVSAEQPKKVCDYAEGNGADSHLQDACQQGVSELLT